MIKSAMAVPMLSTEWQETVSDDDKFQYDGRTVRELVAQNHGWIASGADRDSWHEAR